MAPALPERNEHWWAGLIGDHPAERAVAVRSIKALEQQNEYTRMIISALPRLAPEKRGFAGQSLALLDDPRFAAPYYLSEFLPVPAGEAVMGSASIRSERPVHHVNVNGFSLTQHPVTEAAYRVFVDQANHPSPRHWRRGKPPAERLNMPVVQVSWFDADAYCRWLSAELSAAIYLPSEPEWTLAAAGSGCHKMYPWEGAYHDHRAQVWRGDGSMPVAVGCYPDGTGPYGHADLIGNVWEWTRSHYRPYPYDTDDGRELRPTEGQACVMKGGSWRSRAGKVSISARHYGKPVENYPVTGFRLARR